MARSATVIHSGIIQSSCSVGFFLESGDVNCMELSESPKKMLEGIGDCSDLDTTPVRGREPSFLPS